MKTFLPLLLLLLHFPICAQDISIRKPGAAEAMLDFSGFAAADAPGNEFFTSLRRNLTLPADLREGPPSRATHQVQGQAGISGGRLEVAVQLTDRASGSRVFGKRFHAEPDQAAMLGRVVSDEISPTLTRRPGFAAKRIVLVGRRGDGAGREIYAVFPDGGGLAQLTRDQAVVLAPKWTPDGTSITYTTFHRGFPDVVLHRLNPPGRRVLSSASGMNSGGAISPDGKKVALVLSKDGKPELYVKRLDSGETVRLTRTPMSPKSSPSWSPDGSRIVFVSGHQGSPHLYLIGQNGGEPRRISRGGGENISPHWGKNGLIAHSTRQGGRYQIALLDPESGNSRIISPADADYEDPAWAPDGHHLVVSRTIRGQSSLYLLDMEGKAAQSLLEGRGSWYMPSWSP